jgi:hypothetical protein
LSLEYEWTVQIALELVAHILAVALDISSFTLQILGPSHPLTDISGGASGDVGGGMSEDFAAAGHSFRYMSTQIAGTCPSLCPSAQEMTEAEFFWAYYA